MNISLKDIISLVVKEVVAELGRRGILVESEFQNNSTGKISQQKIIMNFEKYKTPLLTESHILQLDAEVGEIQVPLKTLVTPSAHDLIRKRKILITKK